MSTSPSAVNSNPYLDLANFLLKAQNSQGINADNNKNESLFSGINSNSLGFGNNSFSLLPSDPLFSTDLTSTYNQLAALAMGPKVEPKATKATNEKAEKPVQENENTRRRDTTRTTGPFRRTSTVTGNGRTTIYTSTKNDAETTSQGDTKKPSQVETEYLRANPDVATAVAKGTYKSGLEHFIKVGQKEGRDYDLKSFEYNEQDYLQANPDVAKAVAKGTYKSGFVHFVKYGIKEDRKLK